MVDGRKQTSSHGDVLDEGTVVGRFVVERHVAGGGHARVYRAREATTGQPVAIKVMHAFLAARRDARRRFEREARAVRRLQQRNIVAMLDAGNLADGRPYLVMEWLDGPTLLEELRTVGPLPPARTLAIAEELAAGLAAAHAAGIVHRDLKASNVILAGSPPVAKLLDFGIATPIDARTRPAGTGINVGTPAGMAPEQFAGGAITPATDVYALAVLVFRMLVGRYPFEAANAVEMQDRHLRAPPAVPGDFDPALRPFDVVLLRALEKDPARRHPSVGALVADLRAVAPPLS